MREAGPLDQPQTCPEKQDHFRLAAERNSFPLWSKLSTNAPELKVIWEMSE